MGTTAKLAGFAVVLVAVFGAAFGVGRAVGPWDDQPAPASSPSATSPSTTTTAMEHGGHS